ncbi:lipid IV(A) 3-deoxy-D-manno-octulosonic acid transferase [Porticoccaceae bacterium]|nr:lipid IV(A) 3-deoxy-D-manno-octulosonic acid transferase [Porticoccaceae bacterium]MDB4309224.1 lipid IV(A) 3-deoxy-D-manno-octulosonic acid transferase [Porticoccaceae bacterium]MDB9953380.1 lipid IV(A) 3-deoxy-D-manno-octulosonic acid transferase [Porticoccaceae bacterium]MDB9999045.1 lipid IV(A) 3-deoxy-D-manno-octulosonic acid transferase [Porticoccaceae bacterium]
MSRIIYSAIFYLLTPIILLRLLYRGLKAPAYRKRWAERFGFPVYAESTADCIWLHAVSVGETLAAVPLVKALQEKYPQHRLMVTCMTPTGSERIKAAFGDSVDHSYMPYDTPDAVARFLNRLKPKMLIIMETELWPNTIAACQSRDIPVILANGRLSARSAKAYHRISSVVQPMLSGISAVAAQHKDDGERFTQLGLPLSALAVTGNIKFDLSLDQAVQDRAAALSKQWHCGNNRPVFLAASTHRGEDEIILQAFGQIKQQLDNALLVLVPRHPERFDQVGELCTSAGFTLARHSAGDKVEAADVLLGDTMGELMVFFGACDVAFVGGSLVATGGHNMIEPAAWGVPVLTGPHLFNFTEASQLLLAADGMLVCNDGAELAEQCIALLGNKERRQEMGNAARLVAEANRGALDKLMSVIDRFI